MKKFFLTIKNQKSKIVAMLALGVCCPSCSDFLDIMPDNVLQYEDIFASQKQAMNALATCYLFIPWDIRGHGHDALGDDWAIVNPTTDGSRTDTQGAAIMTGKQSATNTLMSLWTGHNTSANLYALIRDCDLLILNIDLVPDMTADNKADWKAQAQFLKAYYMFRLVEQYGPVVIPKVVDASELNSDMFLYRSKVEDCFDYILSLMNEAIPRLNGKSGINDLGMVDQVVAKAIKARVLLKRASPFYNGNSEYYHNFRDHNGEHFFSQTKDDEKWKAAAQAAQEALDACEQHGFRLYRFTGRPYDFDATDFDNNQLTVDLGANVNPNRMQTLYDLRFRVVERWNEEIIWSSGRISSASMAQAACIMLPETGFDGNTTILPGAGSGQGFAGASFQAMERYYTIHGLPLDEDRTTGNMSELYEIVTTPDENSPEYASMCGLMQPGVSTVKMYLNREPRFYADLGITGGYYRSHRVRIRTTMLQNDIGGYSSALHGSRMNPTGIAVQKNVHPESYYASLNTFVWPSYPVIRVADLWLMLAEALNEYYGPSQEVYDAINQVRRRAGIPDVEHSYSNPEWVTDEALNKHLDKEHLREIILRERAIEFAFETGHRFWDMQRWKRSVTEFSRPISGWNYLGTNTNAFFNQTIVQGRNWKITDCLWPIDTREMDRNARLIQNPGW